MTDVWWQLLKQGAPSNMAPVRGNVPCPNCNGVGTISGTIGYGDFIHPQFKPFNLDHPSNLAANRQENAQNENYTRNVEENSKNLNDGGQ